jgi:hypothetical protein
MTGPDTNIQVNANTGPNISIIIDKLLAVVDDAATKEVVGDRLSGWYPASERAAQPVTDAAARSRFQLTAPRRRGDSGSTGTAPGGAA